jgi:hypothetical protein
MISLIIAIVAGNYTGRNPDRGILETLVVSVILIPIVTVVLSMPLYGLVVLNDWPSGPYVLPPPFAIWAAAVLGGFLGFRSGMIWNHGEASCFYCLLSVAFVLVLISLIVVLIP